jgi:hypothetical protein
MIVSSWVAAQLRRAQLNEWMREWDLITHHKYKFFYIYSNAETVRYIYGGNRILGERKEKNANNVIMVKFY